MYGVMIFNTDGRGDVKKNTHVNLKVGTVMHNDIFQNSSITLSGVDSGPAGPAGQD